MTPTSLAVIVIGLNEAENLRRCFVSVRHALERAERNLALRQVIFVDTGSTDGSEVIAAAYADRVVRFAARTHAAAARQAGAQVSESEYLLFLDGDMELDREWIETALSIMANSGAAGGIAGIRRDVVSADRPGGPFVNENVYRVRQARRANHFGGAILLRRAALEDAGGFDASLPAAEEPDLHARLLSRGHFVIEVPVPFVTHYLKARPRFRTVMARTWDARGFWYSVRSAVDQSYVGGLIRIYPRFVAASAAHITALLSYMPFGWRGVVAIESLALAAFAARGRAKEMPLALMRWSFLVGHLPSVLKYRRGPVPAYSIADGAAPGVPVTQQATRRSR